MSEEAFYIELFEIGHQLRVTAIDPQTGLEAVIIAPKSATKAEITRIVVEKLKRRIAKSLADEASESDQGSAVADRRGGLLI